MTAAELKAARLALGLTRRQLAEATGRSFWSIRAYENRRNMPLSFVKQMEVLSKQEET